MDVHHVPAHLVVTGGASDSDRKFAQLDLEEMRKKDGGMERERERERERGTSSKKQAILCTCTITIPPNKERKASDHGHCQSCVLPILVGSGRT